MRSLIDKLSCHRLLELINHTITTFGHSSLFLERTFETVHQTLKMTLNDDTDQNKHICIYKAAYADCHRHVIHEFQFVNNKIDEDKFLATRNRSELFSGKKHSI